MPLSHVFRRLAGRLRHGMLVAGRAGARMSEEDGFMVAGYMSFTALLAIFPFMIFIAAVLSFIGSQDDLQRIVDLMFDTLPAEVAQTLEPAVAEVVVGRQTGFLTFGILTTLWAASNGVEAIRLAFNRAYRVQQPRPFWLRRLQNILCVMLLGLMTPLLSFLIVLAPLAWRVASIWVELGLTSHVFFIAFRYGISILALLATLLALHLWLPNRRQQVRNVLPGVVFTVLLFLLAGTGFSLYLSNFANMSVTYGSMTSVVIALLFFYLTSAIVILGAYVNASMDRFQRLAA
jgi:membrane protein